MGEVAKPNQLLNLQTKCANRRERECKDKTGQSGQQEPKDQSAECEEGPASDEAGEGEAKPDECQIPCLSVVPGSLLVQARGMFFINYFVNASFLVVLERFLGMREFHLIPFFLSGKPFFFNFERGEIICWLFNFLVQTENSGIMTMGGVGCSACQLTIP